MNPSYTCFYQRPFVIAAGQRRRMIDGMKSLLCSCFVLCLLAIQATAQNLVVNGDFQSGQLEPWTGGELRADLSGNVFARVGETLAQTVTTVPGQRYLLSAELRKEDQFGVEVLMIAQAQGGTFDASRPVGVAGMVARRFSVAFTASSVTTSIGFVVTAPGNYILVDNVTLIAIAPTAADGGYAGTIVTTVTVTDPAMNMKSGRKVTGRINDDGELIVLDGTDGIITGYILNSGEFSLDLPGGKTVTGVAVMRGRRIELEYATGSHAAVTVSGATVANTIKETLSLVRR